MGVALEEVRALIAELQNACERVESVQGDSSSVFQTMQEDLKKLVELVERSEWDDSQSASGSAYIDSTLSPMLKQRMQEVFLPLFRAFQRFPECMSDLALAMVKAYRNMGEMETAEEWCHQLLTNPEFHLSTSTQAQILKQLGHLASKQYQWIEAESYYRRSLALWKSEQSFIEMADIYNNLGYNALQQGVLPQARSFHEQALELIDTTDAPLIRADAHNSLAILASIQSDWELAIEHFESSLHAYQEVQHFKGLAQTYQNLAIAYVDCEEWEAAGKCYEAAVQLAKEHGDTELLADIYVNRAEFLLNLYSFDPAKTYCEKALSLYRHRQTEDTLGVAEAYKLMGRIAYRQQGWEEAEHYIQESIRLYQKCENPQGIAEATYEWGLLQLEQNDVSHAQACLERSKVLFMQLGAQEQIRQVQEALGRCA